MNSTKFPQALGLRPQIVIPLDWEHPGGYSKYPWYAMREHYAQAVIAAGGLPLFVPHDLNLVDSYDCLADGILITGGDFDVTPALYGAEADPRSDDRKENRVLFELALIRKALSTDKPLLGICGGHQLLNVALGGTLIQHIPDTVAAALAHEQPNPRHEVGHDVTVMPGTRLAEISQDLFFQCNSAHHQAVERVGEGAVVNAIAPDGVIEGIEVKDHRFCLGIQWHPEFLITGQDRRIFDEFLKSSRDFSALRLAA